MITANLDFAANYLKQVFPSVNFSEILQRPDGFQLYVSQKQLLVQLPGGEKEIAIAFNSRPFTTNLCGFRLILYPQSKKESFLFFKDLINAHLTSSKGDILVLDEM